MREGNTSILEGANRWLREVVFGRSVLLLVGGLAIGFLTGQIMKKTRGQANAGLVQQLIRESLEVE